MDKLKKHPVYLGRNRQDQVNRHTLGNKSYLFNEFQEKLTMDQFIELVHSDNKITDNVISNTKKVRNATTDQEKLGAKLSIPFVSFAKIKENCECDTCKKYPNFKKKYHRIQSNFAGTHFLVLDIDHLSQAELEIIKQDTDIYTPYIFYTSSSKAGCRVVYPLLEEVTSAEDYKTLYSEFARSFIHRIKDTYGLDLSLDNKLDPSAVDPVKAWLLAMDEEDIIECYQEEDWYIVNNNIFLRKVDKPISINSFVSSYQKNKFNNHSYLTEQDKREKMMDLISNSSTNKGARSEDDFVIMLKLIYYCQDYDTIENMIFSYAPQGSKWLEAKRPYIRHTFNKATKGHNSLF